MKRPLRGLRGRLLIAFVLVTAVATLTTGALTFREARVAVLQQSQDTIIKRLRAHVDGLAAGIAYPPTQSDLERVARRWPLPNRRRTGGCWPPTAACGPPPDHRTRSPS